MSRASRTSSFVSTSATAKRRRKPPVWLRNVYLKTLRDYRVAILGWGIGIGLVIVSPMASVSELVKTPEARAALVSLAKTFVWNADAIAADTVGGYATFKIGIFIFLICIWPLLAASRMLRGEEDRSSLDVLLSVPRGRVRVALEKLAAMWTALLAMAVIIGLLAFVGGTVFEASFGLGDAILFGLDLALLCAVIGGGGLPIRPVPREPRTGTGLAGGAAADFLARALAHPA